MKSSTSIGEIKKTNRLNPEIKSVKSMNKIGVITTKKTCLKKY